MTERIELYPGIRLTVFTDSRFKQNCLSIQYVRKMDRSEAAMNALIPSVLLRGTNSAMDLRQITLRLDELYGASVSPISRRAGDYQTTGFYVSMMDDRFALDGESVLEQTLSFVKDLLFDYPTENGGFLPDFVEGEKVNQIAAIQAELNDKRVYAVRQLLKNMCREDSFGIPRMGEVSDVAAITPQELLDHYLRIRRESPVQLYYVGSAQPQKVARCLREMFALERRAPAGPYTPEAFREAGHPGADGGGPGEALHGLFYPGDQPGQGLCRHAGDERGFRRGCDLQAVSECAGKAEPVLQHRFRLLQRQGRGAGIRRY